ncbi:MAG: PLDc N-terminal domain-containing protein [Promethearchaeota archaeon]
MLFTITDPTAFLTAYMTIVIVLAVIGLIINIILMVWVYKDAEARGMGGALWLIIVFLTSWIGCLIYLIVRGNHPK